jgi:hypothetical protein
MIQCGTAAGYRAHYRHGEPACRPCKDAINAYVRSRPTTGTRRTTNKPTRHYNRNQPPYKRQSFCPICNTEFESRRRSNNQWTSVCSKACEQRRRNPIPRPDYDPRTRRYQRECNAPGLSRTERVALMRRWTKQHRACAYCGQPATAIDHIVPLFRGGTNYEGNLAPVCRRCNSSKGTRFLVEWRGRGSNRDQQSAPTTRQWIVHTHGA